MTVYYQGYAPGQFSSRSSRRINLQNLPPVNPVRTKVSQAVRKFLSEPVRRDDA